MSPGSSSGIASFSFSVSSSQSVINSSSGEELGTRQPPSNLLLCSATTKTPAAKSSGADRLSPLPTMLIFLIKAWLSDKAALQLIMSNRRLRDELQNFYRLKLRTGVAQQSGSPIASYQDLASRQPVHVPMNQNGEWMFQQCMAMKVAGGDAAEYCSRVVQFFTPCIPGARDMDMLLNFCTGAAVALGGQLMPASHRKALVAGILSTYAKSTPAQMGASVMGVCCALGRPDSSVRRANIEHVFRQILSAYQTSTMNQSGVMIGTVCSYFTMHRMPAMCIDFALPTILDGPAASRPDLILATIQGVTSALVSEKLPSKYHVELMKTMFDLYELNRTLPLTEMMHGLFRGLGGGTMAATHLDVVLSAILGRAQSCDRKEIAACIGALCMELGGMNMAPGHRVEVLKRILAGYTTCSAEQMGTIIWSMCYVLGGRLDNNSDITPEVLDAILCQVLHSYGTSSQQQLGCMIRYMFMALGGRNIKPLHRHVLVGRIQKWDHAHEIIAAVKQVQGGVVIADFLKLDSAGA